MWPDVSWAQPPPALPPLQMFPLCASTSPWLLPPCPCHPWGGAGGLWQGRGSLLSAVSQQKQDADDEEELEIAVDNTAFMDEFFSEVRDGWERGWDV